MAIIGGVGWINQEGYGCIKQRLSVSLKGRNDLPREEIFALPFNNFGRLDQISKMAAYAVALALRDAGMAYPLHGRTVGIVGSAPGGCLPSDINYFKDYLEHGRTLSRGNLFIYTLPSSHLSEAAIHFGLQGPLFYLTDRTGSLDMVMDMAKGIIDSGEAAMMLAGIAGENAAIYTIWRN